MLTALDWAMSSLSNVEHVEKIDKQKRDVLFVVTFFAIAQAALGVRKVLKTKAKRVGIDELSKNKSLPPQDDV
jgi:hypothetical protein